MIPNLDEWDTSNLPDFRRAYLDAGHSFEDIAALIVDDPKIQKNWIRPRYNLLNTNFRQVCFRIHRSTASALAIKSQTRRFQIARAASLTPPLIICGGMTTI
jgi:hypothetical protein